MTTTQQQLPAEKLWSRVPDLRNLPDESSPSLAIDTVSREPEEAKEAVSLQSQIERDLQLQSVFEKLISSRPLMLVVIVLIGLGIYSLIPKADPSTNQAVQNAERENLSPVWQPVQRQPAQRQPVKQENALAKKNGMKIEVPEFMLSKGHDGTSRNAAANAQRQMSQPPVAFEKNYRTARQDGNHNKAVETESLYPATSHENQLHALPPEIAKKIGLSQKSQSQRTNHQNINQTNRKFLQKASSSEQRVATGRLTAGHTAVGNNPFVNKQQNVPGTAQFQGELIINNPHTRVTNEQSRPSIHQGLRR